MSWESPIDLCAAQVSCEQPATFERAAGDLPEAIVDCFAADIFAPAGRCHVDPLMVPTKAPVGPDGAPLEAVGVCQRGQAGGPLTG